MICKITASYQNHSYRDTGSWFYLPSTRLYFSCVEIEGFFEVVQAQNIFIEVIQFNTTFVWREPQSSRKLNKGNRKPNSIRSTKKQYESITCNCPCSIGNLGHRDPGFATHQMPDLGQVVNLLCLSFLICEMGIVIMPLNNN